MKKLLKVVVVLLLLVIVAVIGVIFYLDTIVRHTIERGGTHALGVETTLDSARLRPLRGQAAIEGLRVANPDGYQTERFLGIGSGNVAVTLASIRSEVVELPVLRLDDVEVFLEKREGRANYAVILENLKRFETGPKPEVETAGKKFVIREVRITDLRASVELLPLGGSMSRTTVPIDEIRLEQVGSAGNPVGTGELVAIVVEAIFAAIVESGVDLPGAIGQELSNALAGLSGLADAGVGVLVEGVGQVGAGAAEELGTAIGGAADGAGKAIEGAAEEAGKAIEGATRGLGGILGGGKKKDDGGGS